MREKEKKKTNFTKEWSNMWITYLALVPLIGLLQVLLGQFIVLAADLVENLGQVGIL